MKGQWLGLAVFFGVAIAHPATLRAATIDANVAVTVDAGQRNPKHVRTASRTIAAAIDTAMERSATFRALVATIEASDSIVFLTEGTCQHQARACFVALKPAGAFRLMFVEIDSRYVDWDLMGSIGHELRHTVEVINDPSVRTDAEKYFLYRRIGWHSTNGNPETIEAMDAGNAVRAEVRQAARRAKVE
jgi:hypothetical protein